MKPLPNWKKTLLPAALALALIVPAAAYAADQADQNANQQNGASAQKQAQAHRWEGKGRFHGKPMEKFSKFSEQAKTHLEHMKINQQKYLELLAEKYAPDSLNDWKAALSEQTRLTQELKDLFKNEQVRSALKSEKKKMEEQRKSLMDELRKKLESGEITKEQMKKQLKEQAQKLGLGTKGPIAADREKLQEDREHRKELTEAIKANDADAIRAALAKLLDDLKKGNEQLAAKLNELKQKAAASSSQSQS